MKDVDAEYYGYRDEDDGVLLPLEAQYEKQGTSCANAGTRPLQGPSRVHCLHRLLVLGASGLIGG